jgi:hypothetical protein
MGTSFSGGRSRSTRREPPTKILGITQSKLRTYGNGNHFNYLGAGMFISKNCQPPSESNGRPLSTYCAKRESSIAISWGPVLVVEEAGVPGENHRPWASNRYKLYDLRLRVECTLCSIGNRLV